MEWIQAVDSVKSKSSSPASPNAPASTTNQNHQHSEMKTNKTAEDYHHTAGYISHQRAHNPNWQCTCISCSHLRKVIDEVQSDARLELKQLVLPGIKAQHAIITPTCRLNRGNIGALAEAVARIEREYRAVMSGRTDDYNFHLVLTVETIKDEKEILQNHSD